MISLDKKPWESDTLVLIREGFCHCAATAEVVRLKKTQREVELHSAAKRSAGAERKSRGHAENWRGKPCFWCLGFTHRLADLLHVLLNLCMLQSLHGSNMNWNTQNSSWKCHHGSVSTVPTDRLINESFVCFFLLRILFETGHFFYAVIK